jgi:hypothetical protein
MNTEHNTHLVLQVDAVFLVPDLGGYVAEALVLRGQVGHDVRVVDNPKLVQHQRFKRQNERAVAHTRLPKRVHLAKGGKGYKILGATTTRPRKASGGWSLK